MTGCGDVWTEAVDCDVGDDGVYTAGALPWFGNTTPIGLGAGIMLFHEVDGALVLAGTVVDCVAGGVVDTGGV